MSKLIMMLIIIGTIVGGVSYAVFSDPDFAAQGIFKATLREFAKQSGEQENQFQVSQTMKPIVKRFDISFAGGNSISNNEETQRAYLLRMTVSDQSVTLLFEGEKGPMAGQTIILEPVIETNSVKWKCINGNVLVRVRTKNCRLGYGHTNVEMLTL